MKPSDYSRRVLLMTLGRTPQVVTETLYALAVEPTLRGQAAFVPTEIHVITTVQGQRQASMELLPQGRGRLGELCRSHGLDRPIRFDADTIHVVDDAQGLPLHDIRSVDDNSSAANGIVQRVREITADPDCALHVSLAGGRKTMGFYLGYALSLFGRPQDRLSHVLVEESFEGLPEFYFPTRSSQLIKTTKRILDARDAQVTLAEIPFVSLRGHLGAEILGDANARYSDIVRRAGTDLERDTRRISLRLEFESTTAYCGGYAVRFTAPEFAWYTWLASRCRQRQAFVHWKDVDAAPLRAIVDQLSRAGASRLEDRHVDTWFTQSTQVKEFTEIFFCKQVHKSLDKR